MDPRALVVCSEEKSASLLMAVLSELGMAAEHAPSISRGLELVDSQRFDAIVLDYRADQSSEEFLARLRQSSKNCASLLIAIVDREFNARPIFGLGAGFVLYRPLSPERTRISLRAACGLARRERRRSPRLRVTSAANVAFPGAPEMSAVLRDLSDGGTVVQSANPLPRACRIYFEFALPGQQRIVRLSGEVAWQDAKGRTGIHFLDVPQASRRLIQDWLQRESVHAASAVPAQPPAAQSGSGPESEGATLVTHAGERRGELRYACKLGAEVYSFGSNVPNRCSLSDISENGCYIEMPTPLTGQSGVEIVVRTAETKLKIRGEVLATHPGFGMGVRFMFRDSGEREEILRLLAVVIAGSALDEQPH
ncbi:MAG: PilZ domain-containing protein [Terriglobales bacterium]|jgi:CheY-like chemotaxis protein